ncbi:MAG: Smr/MutS family protein, partial [Alphaproteobacteria bacterium]
VPEPAPTPPAASPGARPGAAPQIKTPAAETQSYADLPELQAGAAIGLDKRTAERLRRGQLPIEATVDLHGMTQAEAHGALGAFLARCHAHGRRSVLVITGKGARSERGEGVLRATVPRWLNAPENRARVLAFATAQPKDGGAGALYVLLRRVRDR